jgi:DNA-binding NarL/FixJ family response regulator
VKNNPRIRVMCVDDNELVADAVKRRIAFESKFEWVGWVAHTGEVTDRVQQAKPDVMLFDIDMPGRDAFDVVRELAEQFPEARAVMFSGYVRGDYIDRAIECGAWGYVSKNASIDEVLLAVENVAKGEFAFTGEALTEQRRFAKQQATRRAIAFEDVKSSPT